MAIIKEATRVPQRAAFRTRRTKPASAAAAMIKGPAKLTDAERERCFKENLCFRCRGPGHRSSECTKYPSNNRQRSLNY